MGIWLVFNGKNFPEMVTDSYAVARVLCKFNRDWWAYHEEEGTASIRQAITERILGRKCDASLPSTE